MKTLLFIFFFFGSFSIFSQSELQINCFEDPAYNFQNNFTLDGNTIEYGLCLASPAFYVAVLDTNCTAWETTYQGNLGHDLGNYNVEGSCRPRVEYYFIYRQNDLTELKNLDSLINFWIPDNHTFIIYTPLSFSFSSINSLSPELGQTLIDNWGDALQDATMAVMFGVKGYPNSYEVDTTIISGKIQFIQTICPHFEQTAGISIPDNTDNIFMISPNPIGNELIIKSTQNNELDLKKVEIYNELGLKLKLGTLEQQLNGEYTISTSHLASGTYLVRLFDSKGQQLSSRTIIKK